MNEEVQVFVPGAEPSQVVEAPTSPQHRSAIASAIMKRDFKDHFSLEVASSNVRFRSSKNFVKVFSTPNSQFVLEESFDESGERKVVAKRMADSTAALLALRATYTLVVLFFTGFLFVFCAELLLFLILDLTIEVGVTSKSDVNVTRAIGTILALPVYVHGLASALVIATHYVKDTWNGHILVKRFVLGRFNGVLTEWVSFTVFLGLPLLVMAGSLFSGSDSWWEITALTWFACVTAFYFLFAITIVWFENRACLSIMKNRYDDDVDTYPQLLKRSVLLRQAAKYSGAQHTVYLASGSVGESFETEPSESEVKYQAIEATHRTSMSFLSTLSTWKFLSTDGGLGLFQKLEEPLRTYTVEDARGIRPYVTTNSWSLEKMYCRSRDARYVAVVKGPESLTVAQMRSSFVCAVIGNLLVLFLVAGALVWLGLPSVGVLFVVVLVVIFGMLPGARISYRLYLMTKDIAFTLNNDEVRDAEEVPQDADKASDNFENEASEGVYQVWETYRITGATDRLCWLTFSLEVFFFYLWPAASLFAIRNYTIAVLFVFVAVLSGSREYLNAALVLEEVGNMDLICGKTTKETWLKQSRINTIIKDISRSRSQGAWSAILLVFLFAFLGLFGLAIAQESDTTSDFAFTYLPDFEYVSVDNLEYPTCTIGKGIQSLGTSATTISDYAFIAALAYRDPNITQNELDQWFYNSASNGTSGAVDQQDYVDAYRTTNNITSAVSFKLIDFPGENLSLVAVRGTTNAWDALTDAQLWSPAGLFQALRLLLPLGEIWTPILDSMVNIVSWLESAAIDRVAFYKETTKFVNHLKNAKVNPHVQITGHSLGGGLAMITGAQTGIAAVALSGPNAKISRDTFSPPVTLEALDTWVFNIIPDRDIVPRFDDVSRLFQKIRCIAPINDFAGCHDGRRSLCEIIHTCGTGIRPALCDCTTEFGYPEPTPKAGVTKTFKEECAVLIESSGYIAG